MYVVRLVHLTHRNFLPQYKINVDIKVLSRVTGRELLATYYPTLLLLTRNPFLPPFSHQVKEPNETFPVSRCPVNQKFYPRMVIQDTPSRVIDGPPVRLTLTRCLLNVYVGASLWKIYVPKALRVTFLST